MKLVTNVHNILHFAEFGVVLMRFLVGLEREPKRLWNLRRPIFGWGSAHVLGCTALLTSVAMAFGVGWGGKLHWSQAWAWRCQALRLPCKPLTSAT